MLKAGPSSLYSFGFWVYSFFFLSQLFLISQAGPIAVNFTLIQLMILIGIYTILSVAFD